MENVPGLFATWLTVLGLMVGSFLNVVIARVPHNQSIVRPRSRCPKCGHSLAWFENIPVLSWLFLRGKCRGCRAPISLRYPAIELLTGALFLASLVRFEWTLELGMALLFVSLVIPLTFIDLEHWILPFELTIPGIVSGLAFSFAIGKERFIDAAIGAAVGFGSFWLLEWVGEKVFKKEALGGGDKYLFAMIGTFLTYQPLLGVAFLASTQGAIVGSLLLWTRGRAGPAPTEPQNPTPPALPETQNAAQPVSAASQEASPEPQPSPEAPQAPVTGSEASPAPAVSQQSAPAAPVDEKSAASVSAPSSEAEEDWVPGPTNLPFGPWLSLAGLEILLLQPVLAAALPRHLAWFVGGDAF